VDVVLLTDHDTLAAKRVGEERWYGDVLVLVGVEISPPDRDHFLAFGIDEEISRHQSGKQISEAVAAAGGFGFGAHPFSRGSERFKRPGMKFRDPDSLEGIELWSFLNDTGERVRGFRDLARMILAPQRAIGGPPEGNLREWDRLCQARRVVAIGGLDAHQFGLRIGNHVPLRLMSYRRSFKQLHTHVLCERAPTGQLEHDRALVYGALREGRCYIANDQVADARGFAVWACNKSALTPFVTGMGSEVVFEPGLELHVRTPQPAQIRLLHDGEVVATSSSNELRHSIERYGILRAEVMLRNRPWIYSNPVYVRG
jgi:hypothetical protein